MNLRPRLQAFTILELLVAVAVLALLSVMLLQIVDQTMRSTGTATRGIEQTSAARRALDALEADFTHAARTGGAAVLVKTNPPPEMDDLAFLVHGRGPASTGSPSDAAPRFLAVSWWSNNGTIWRGYAPAAASASNPLDSAVQARQGSSYPPTPVAGGIVRGLVLFEFVDGSLALQPPPGAAVAAGGDYHGSTVPGGWSALLPPVPDPADGTPRVRALIVCMATLDDISLAKLGATGVEAVRDALADPSSQAQMRDLPGYWESLVSKAPSLPAVAGQGLRVFQKRIPLL